MMCRDLRISSSTCICFSKKLDVLFKTEAFNPLLHIVASLFTSFDANKMGNIEEMLFGCTTYFSGIMHHLENAHFCFGKLPSLQHFYRFFFPSFKNIIHIT